jgi:hypothetical protein
MNTKTPESWQVDSNTRDVLIELSVETSLMLPFDHFMFAELRNGQGHQNLRLVFATHEILISGHSLRRVAVAIQRRELSWLAKTPSPRNTIADGQALIMEISVKEITGSGSNADQ